MIKSNYGNPKCKYCDTEMEMDDIDFNFKGNQDEYFTCPTCTSTLYRKIRYGKVVYNGWTKSE